LSAAEGGKGGWHILMDKVFRKKSPVVETQTLKETIHYPSAPDSFSSVSARRRPASGD